MRMPIKNVKLTHNSTPSGKGLWYDPVHWGTSWLGRGTSWPAGMGDMDGRGCVTKVDWGRLRELRVWIRKRISKNCVQGASLHFVQLSWIGGPFEWGISWMRDQLNGGPVEWGTGWQKGKSYLARHETPKYANSGLVGWWSKAVQYNCKMQLIWLLLPSPIYKTE